MVSANPDPETMAGSRQGLNSASAGKVLMLVENYFPADTRVRNEARTLSEAGYQVTVIALRQRGEIFREKVGDISVYRVPALTLFGPKSAHATSRLRRMLSSLKTSFGYGGEYLYFTAACLLLSIYVALKEGFDVIHAHNPPDTLFVVGALFRPFGKRFVFDHHDLSPELYQSRFGVGESFITRALLMLEKLSLRLSTVSIATNESYKRMQIERGRRDPSRVFVVRNGPDLDRLKKVAPDPDLKGLGKTILLYVGEMNPQDGVDYMLRALRHLAYDLGRRDFFCVVVGKGDSLEDLRSLAHDLQLDDYIRFTGFVPEEDLLRYLATADICLDPNPSSPLNDHSTWIKVMEYMAMEKPIVSFDLKETRFSAQDAALYATPNDEAEFAEAIVRLMNDPGLQHKMGSAGRKRVEQELNWQAVSANLLKAYQAVGR